MLKSYLVEMAHMQIALIIEKDGTFNYRYRFCHNECQF